METKITMLRYFFEDPNRGYYIRELSRLLRINHTTVRQRLNKLIKEDLLYLEKANTLYPVYKPVISRSYLNLKLYYNLEKLRDSGILDDINRLYDYPTIIVFGSYANATDNIESDIDLCVMTNIKKELNTKDYERALNRRISVHFFTKDSWERAKKKSPAFVNSICNGIVLSGQLEVL